MLPPRPAGLVYTFYSFKGGVGRSMALANVAALLSRTSRVLIVDWDLEAPGLEKYFLHSPSKLFSSRCERDGIVELIDAFCQGNERNWRDCTLEASAYGGDDRLTILPAGRDSEGYIEKVQGLDWPRLFRETEIGWYLDRLRQEWIAEYDFVLLDSRTGITDIGGICTVLMPDILVLLFTTNAQSVDGVVDVITRARKAQDKLMVDRSRLLAVPVPARDESRTENKLASEWRKIFSEKLGFLYKDWLPKDVEPEDVLEKLRIPYIPYWSFYERLPVVEEGTEDPQTIGFAYHLLSRLIRQRLDWEKAVNEPHAQEKMLWNIPPRNPFFFGREDCLWQLRATFNEGGISALPQVIKGLAGVGKTQLAIEYAYRYRDDYRAGFWVLAESHDTFSSGLASFAPLLDLPDQSGQDLKKTANAVKYWLESNHDWLLVLDNVEDWSVIREWLPSSSNGHVLITTRLQPTGTVAQGINLESMTLEEGSSFLLRRINMKNPSDTDREAAIEITRELGGLPLALEQAAAFMEETPASLKEYLRHYQTAGKKLRARAAETSDQDSVTRTFELTFRSLSAQAKDILQTCTFLASDAIPEELLTQDTESDLHFYEAIGELAKLSLIRRNPNTKTINIHRLVQDVVRDEMNQGQKELKAEEVIKSLDIHFPEPDFRNWPYCERLLPHARVGIEWIDKYSFDPITSARLMDRVAKYVSARAHYAEAESLFLRALQLIEKTIGPDALDNCEYLDGLAANYISQKKYQEAEPLYQRALKIRERVLGPGHPEVATSLNSLAGLYVDLGQYAKAEPLLRRALAIRGEVLGPAHPDTAQSLNNLAYLLQDQGNLAEAEMLFRQTLAIREQILGPMHPDTATALNNLAYLLQEGGNLAEAEPLLRRALAICEQTLSPTHPKTALSLNNLAYLLQAKGDLAGAEPLYRQAVTIYEQNLGPQHPNAIILRKNLDALLSRKNRPAEMKELPARQPSVPS